MSFFEPTNCYVLYVYLVHLQYFIWKSFYLIITKRFAIPLALSSSLFKEYLSQHLSVGILIFPRGCESFVRMLNIKS